MLIHFSPLTTMATPLLLQRPLSSPPPPTLHDKDRLSPPGGSQAVTVCGFGCPPCAKRRDFNPFSAKGDYRRYGVVWVLACRVPLCFWVRCRRPIGFADVYRFSVSCLPSRGSSRDPVRGAVSPAEAMPAASSLPQEPRAGTDHHPQFGGRHGVEPETRGTAVSKT